MDKLEKIIKILNFILLIGGVAISAYKKVRSTQTAKFYGISEKYFTKFDLNNKEDFYYVVFGIIINIILMVFLKNKVGNLIDSLIIKVILYSLFILSNIVIIFKTALNLKYYIPLGILLLESIIIISWLVLNKVIKNYDIILYIFTIVFISSYIILFFSRNFYFVEYILDYEIIKNKDNKCSENLVVIQSGSEDFIACRFFVKEIEKRTKIRKNLTIEKVLFIEKGNYVFIDPKDYYFENIHFDRVEMLEREKFEEKLNNKTTVEKRKSKQDEKNDPHIKS